MRRNVQLRRTGPPPRRTGLAPTPPPARRTPMPRNTKPLPQRSAKAIALQPARDRCRRLVLARAAGRCEYAPVIPELPCRFYPPDRPSWEVDELRGGTGYRREEMTDPDRCGATCPAHHDWKTGHKRVFLARLRSALADWPTP